MTAKRCGCYIPATDGSVPKCMGTRELDHCLCGGDETKCDFYESKRKAAKTEKEVKAGKRYCISYLKECLAVGAIPADKASIVTSFLQDLEVQIIAEEV